MDVRVHYVDFWEGFDPSCFSGWFDPEINLVYDMVNPEFVFYSCFGFEHLRYKHAIKVFLCFEPCLPDFGDCDYCVGTVRVDFMNRTYWVPLAYLSSQSVVNVPDVSREEAINREFCSFIYSQDNLGEGAILRKEVCQRLMEEYKHVCCPGKVLHNCDAEELAGRFAKDGPASKIRYMQKFKFAFAFENHSLPGYITEKLVDCYRANTVPIYWGSDGDVSPYPKESMIMANDYPDVESLILRIKEVDNDDNLYMSILNANPYRRGGVSFKSGIQAFMRNMIEHRKPLFPNTNPFSAARKCQELTEIMESPACVRFFRLQRVVRALRSRFLQFKKIC